MVTKICSKCGKETEENMNFCDNCGTPLKIKTPKKEILNSTKIIFCPKCGIKLLDNAYFCDNCGTKIINSVKAKNNEKSEKYNLNKKIKQLNQNSKKTKENTLKKIKQINPLDKTEEKNLIDSLTDFNSENLQQLMKDYKLNKKHIKIIKSTLLWEVNNFKLRKNQIVPKFNYYIPKVKNGLSPEEEKLFLIKYESELLYYIKSSFRKPGLIKFRKDKSIFCEDTSELNKNTSNAINFMEYILENNMATNINLNITEEYLHISKVFVNKIAKSNKYHCLWEDISHYHNYKLYFTNGTELYIDFDDYLKNLAKTITSSDFDIGVAPYNAKYELFTSFGNEEYENYFYKLIKQTFESIISSFAYGPIQNSNPKFKSERKLPNETYLSESEFTNLLSYSKNCMSAYIVTSHGSGGSLERP